LLTMILLLFLFILGMGFKKATGIKPGGNNPAGFAVIELFTSEGCSSCPAADAAVEKFIKENQQPIFVLAFHVDYWNKLGWKDVFSKPDYTARQSKYASVLGLESIYTPQIIVNGIHEFVGSNSSQLKRVVEKELANGKGKPFHVTASLLAGNQVEITYRLNERQSSNLNIALIQLHAASDVKRGENQGRHLDHINVVRDFKTIPLSDFTGKANLLIPAGLNKDDCKIIAYLQDAVSMKITGVSEVNIQ
jgi:hypothetical protein